MSIPLFLPLFDIPPGSSLLSSSSPAGDSVLQYAGPSPPRGSGPHRYILLVLLVTLPHVHRDPPGVAAGRSSGGRPPQFQGPGVRGQAGREAGAGGAAGGQLLLCREQVTGGEHKHHGWMSRKKIRCFLVGSRQLSWYITSETEL